MDLKFERSTVQYRQKGKTARAASGTHAHSFTGESLLSSSGNNEHWDTGLIVGSPPVCHIRIPPALGHLDKHGVVLASKSISLVGVKPNENWHFLQVTNM